MVLDGACAGRDVGGGLAVYPGRCAIRRLFTAPPPLAAACSHRRRRRSGATLRARRKRARRPAAPEGTPAACPCSTSLWRLHMLVAHGWLACCVEMTAVCNPPLPASRVGSAVACSLQVSPAQHHPTKNETWHCGQAHRKNNVEGFHSRGSYQHLWLQDAPRNCCRCAAGDWKRASRRGLPHARVH